MGESTQDALSHFQNLLGRPATSVDLESALAHGLAAMSAEIAKRRFAATDRPRARRRSSCGRHIPAQVKREVRLRDGDRCTFVAANGHRCEARSCLEYDHIKPVARGGTSTVQNLRLRCRAHNQYEAEQTFGAGFMKEKRERARRSRAAQSAEVTPSVAAGAVDEGSAGAAAPPVRPDDASSASAKDLDVAPCLRQLGFRTAEIRRAAEHCDLEPGARLEARVRAALSFLAPRVRGKVAVERAGGFKTT